MKKDRSSPAPADTTDLAADRPTRAARPPLPGDPVISVVVRSGNHGHFLTDCLDSLFRQTWPADQIVVVDDGSTDATDAILAAQASRVQVIRNACLGQGEAFNTGWAAARGDIVLWLDAADRLRPEALETILAHWSGDLAALTFGLEILDAMGRSTGVDAASVAPDTGDNRPRLLASGAFAGPPLSGMAFSRACLAAALPMAGPRWRTGAGGYLIRAAALFGRFARAPHVLGACRLHEDNDPDLAQGAADALEDLSAAAERFAAGPEETAALAAALRHREDALRQRGETGRKTGKDGQGARTAAAALMLPRWPAFFADGADLDLADPSVARRFLIPDEEGGLPASRLSLCLAIDSAPTDQRLTLDLAPPEGCGADGSDVRLWLDGRLAAETRLTGPRAIDLPVARDPWARSRRLRIDIDCAAAAGGARPGFRPRLGRMRLTAPGPADAWPCLSPGVLHAPGRALAAAPPAGGWTLDADFGLALSGPGAQLRLTAPGPDPMRLILTFAEPPPRGWLEVSAAGERLFQGATGPAAWLDIPLPPGEPEGRRDLSLRFEPREGEERPLRLTGIGLAPVRDLMMAGAGEAWTRLNPGETVVFGHGPRGTALLGPGWEPQDGSPAALGAEAELALCLPHGCTRATLRLTVAPLLDPLPGLAHILGLSQDGALRAAARLDGRGSLDVAVSAGPGRGPGALVRLALHSIYRCEGEEAGDGMAAGLRLISLELLDCDGIGPPLLPPAPAEPGPPAWLAALDRVGALLAGPPDAERTGALARLRADLARFLYGCDVSACLILAVTPERISRLTGLGTALMHAPRAAGDEAAVAQAAKLAASDDPAERLRAALLSLLFLPAARAPIGADLAALPAPVLWAPEAWAAWLAAPPPTGTEADHAAHVTYLDRLYASLDAALAQEPPGSAAHRLAVATLAALHGAPVMFGAGVLTGLIRRRARVAERLLAQRGAALAWAPGPRRPRDRLRIGVLVRDLVPTPEGWAALGMYAGLDPARFDVTLIRMARAADALDGGAVFPTELSLAGRTVDEAVAAIRALDLDLFVTGCYAPHWETVAAIQAHRLARVQVWNGAVCPTTGGHRSFDVALSCRATEPDAPERHYAEPLAWIDGPLQCAYDFPPAAPRRSGRVRREIGVDEDALMLVSGALAHKISDELMALWAAILAALPEAALVLYPFAPNWSLAFDEAAFRARFDRALAAAGIKAGRLILLPTQTPRRVRDILAAADLYLDSLPYAGATTVCEALSCGTPVLTCAGDGLRQMTGASWVRAYGLNDLVAGSAGDYRDRAIRLGRDRGALKALRQRIADRLAEGPPPHCDPAAFGTAFGAVLDRIAAAHGLIPPVAAPTAPPVAPRRRAQPARIDRFVILGQPRTGSTLLCKLLDRAPDVRCHAELFHADMIQFHDRHLSDTGALSARDADRAGFLIRLAEEAAADGCRAMGFKHFDFFGEDVTDLAIADPGVKIIHLSRADILAQFASFVAAKQTGDWFSVHGAGPPVRKIVFETGDFEIFEGWINAGRQKRLNRLAEAGRAALFLDFEQVISGEALSRISDFLDLPIPSGSATDIRRQDAPPLLDRFENPEDVSAYQARRGWASGG